MATSLLGMTIKSGYQRWDGKLVEGTVLACAWSEKNDAFMVLVDTGECLVFMQVNDGDTVEPAP